MTIKIKVPPVFIKILAICKMMFLRDYPEIREPNSVFFFLVFDTPTFRIRRQKDIGVV